MRRAAMVIANGRRSAFHWSFQAAGEFLVLGAMADEHFGLVTALGLEVDDEADVADAHDRGQYCDLGERALLGFGQEGFDFGLLFGWQQPSLPSGAVPSSFAETG